MISLTQAVDRLVNELHNGRNRRSILMKDNAKLPNSEKEAAPVPRAKIPELRREQILEAALRVFSAKGADNATNRDIAEAAGLGSPGLIYHYFRDRNDLLRQVLLKFHPVSMLLDNEALNDASDLEGCLRQTAETVNSLASQRELCQCLKITVFELLKNPESRNVVFETLPKRLIARLSEAFAYAQAQKRIKSIPPRILAVNFLGAVIYPILLNIVFNYELTVDPALQTDIFLKGILL